MDFNPKKISENFKSIPDFKDQTYRVRRCWQTCYHCGTDFSHFDVLGSVHMVVTFSNETRFVCDNCNIELKSLPL